MGALLPATIRAQQSVAVQPKDDRSATKATEELLQRPISIELDRVSLKEAIDSVAAVGGILVQYRLASVSGYSGKVSVHADKTPLGIVFARVLQGTDLQLIAHRNAAFVVAPTNGAVAEQGPGVSGVVTSAKSGQPLQGATVTMDDGSAHQLTDAKGHFAFADLSAGSHRVAVRMIGYARQVRTVTVSNDQPLVLSFALDASTNMLDQVVVTATGAQRYRELGHVVEKLNADSLVKVAPIRTLSDLLTSRVPGLAVMNGNGGVAGGEVAMRLRAQTSVSLDPQPIIIVDGVRYHSNNTVMTFYSSGSNMEDTRPFNAEERSPLNDLNVNDIESVEVVKGPSASTLYGPDAANGVIVVKTKRGEVGKARWNVYLHPDLATITKTASHRASTGYWAWGHDASGATTPYSCTLDYQYYNYCVLDSVTKRPVAEQLSDLNILTKNRPAWQGGANVSGGTEAFRYFFSFGYDWQTGSIAMSPIAKQQVIAWLGPDALTGKLRDPNTQQMTSVRSNLSSDLNPKLTMSFAAGFTQTNQRAINLSNLAGNLASAGVTSPGCSENDNNNRCTYIDWIGVFMNSTERTGTRFTGTLDPVFRPREWVTFTGSIGADIDHSIDRGIHPNGGSYAGDQGSIQDNRRDNTNYTGSLTAVARNRAGRYTFQTSVGTQYTKSQLDGVDMNGYGLAPGSNSITSRLT